MSNRETGKTRAQRIELDYHSRRDTFSRTRWILVLVATLLAGSYATFAIIGERFSSDSSLSRIWATHTSTGPLAEVHTAFQADCKKCHGDGFQHPLAHDAWQSTDDGEIFQRAQWIAGKSCNTAGCHQVEHHFIETLKQSEKHRELNCVRCHRDHLGTDHDIASVADASCTECHAQLRGMVADQPTVTNLSIHAFTRASHGEFAALGDRREPDDNGPIDDDPGEIRFDHFQHLQPGQIEPPAAESKSRAGFTKDRLAAKWQSRYQSTAKGLVQLSCKDCHESNSVGSAGLSADSTIGRNFAPVRFDRHCAACHELNYAGRTGDVLPLPHAAPRAEIVALLRAKMESGRLDGTMPMPSDTRRNVSVPGKGAEESGSTFGVDDDLMDQQLVILSARCEQCHLPKHLEEGYVTAAAAGETKPLIPDRWFQRGSFDHAAHINMDCRFCHGKIYQAGETEDPIDDRTVMIDGIESCALCHRPADAPTPGELQKSPLVEYVRPNANTTQPTWASDRCVVCHKYHWTRPATSAPTSQALSDAPANPNDSAGGSP